MFTNNLRNAKQNIIKQSEMFTGHDKKLTNKVSMYLRLSKKTYEDKKLFTHFVTLIVHKFIKHETAQNKSCNSTSNCI